MTGGIVKIKLTTLALAAIVTASFSGCAHYAQEPDFQSRLNPSTTYKKEWYTGTSQWPPYAEVYTQRFVWKMRYLVNQMFDTASSRGGKGMTVLMTTIAPVDNLTAGTSFGRVVTEQLMTEMNMRGFRVIEARKTTDYMVADKRGEFSLSRDIKKIASDFSADAVLVGTYSRGKEQVLLNVRLVDLRDSSTLGAGSAMMDLRGDRYLMTVFGDDLNARGGVTSGLASVNMRKRVLPDVDHYSETLQAMIKTMAGRISEGALTDNGGIKTIAVATFVDINHLYRATAFGRYMGEQLISELSSIGFNVVELRVAPEIIVDMRLGEMALTREMNKLAPNGKLDAIVVGTYTKAGDTVLANGRMILPKSGKVVGVGDITVDAGPRNKFMAGLMEQEITTMMPTETVEGY
jgi:TolB-like protein